ncbi:MAG TPA: glycine cleavage system aminomethyltransferase GcvT [Nitrospira sp.]|nr:glycine cleavage system aminomethyltransferase GcvT [Nitrospira sp.]
MKQTPLIAQHRTAGAKLVDFAGWEMPIQYSGVVDEYHTVRSKAGLFDVSHMGRINVSGPGSVGFLQYVTTNDVSKISVHSSQYSMVCNPKGGIQDDIFIYHVKPYEFLVCVNASNREKIVAWLLEKVSHVQGCKVKDCSTDLAQIAVQGPLSRDLLIATGMAEVADLKVRQCLEVAAFGGFVIVSRTGYTGELGYELYLPAHLAEPAWVQLLKVGQPQGLKPAGLGARDLLRLDMGYLLYGNDISEDISPLEAGAEWVVNFEKCEFIGRQALLTQRTQGLAHRLVGFELLEKAVPRHGFTIISTGPESQPIGTVTSGNLSPVLQKGIGLGSVLPHHAEPGTRILIDIRGKAVPAMVVKLPFYKKPKS